MRPRFPRYQGGGHRAGLPAIGVGDAPGQRVAGVVYGGCQRYGAGQGRGRRLDVDLAYQGTDGTDPAKIGIPGEIISAGAGRVGRR